MPCLDENTLLALAQGALSPEEFAAAQKHLDACAACRRIAAVVAGSTSLGPAAAPAAPGPMPPPPLGAPIGRYFVVESLGQGGMGQVLLAYDPKLDRKVALKRVRRRRANLPEEARARLLREAQAMARLSHPNVLAVHDVTEIGGELFIAMEYVRGRTLREWQREPRGWREILAMYCHAGEGLAAAHRAGLVHRDFKPDNVLIGEDGRVRVTDFGLARFESGIDLGPDEATSPGALDSAALLHTETGVVVGTPGYIAPEALWGERGPLSDQFSFFVALYEALTGVRPFEGRSLPAQIKAAERGQIRPPPPGHSLPKWLSRAVLKGLEADPARRFPSMAEALAALSHAPRRSRQRSLGAAVALGLAAVASAAIWARGNPERLCSGSERYLSGLWDEEGKKRVRAAFLASGAPQAELAFDVTARALDAWVETWIKMRTETCRATRVFGEQSVETMEAKLACLDVRWMDFEALARRFSEPSASMVPDAVTAASRLPSHADCLHLTSSRGQAPPAGSVERANAERLSRQLAEARACLLVAAVDPGLRLAQPVEQEARKLGLDALRAESLLVLARLRDRLGEHAAAEEDLFEAMALAQARGLDALVAEISVELVVVLGPHLRRFADAHRWEKLAQASLVRAGLSGQEQEARLLFNTGIIANFESAHDVALRSYQKALEIRERLYGPDHFLVAEVLANLAAASVDANRLDEARVSARRALAIREKLFGPEHRSVARALLLIGRITFSAGDLTEGLALLERAAALAQRAVPGDGLFQFIHLADLAEARARTGDLRGAEEACQRALAIARERLGENHARVGSMLATLATIARLKGELPRSIELGEDALRRLGPEVAPWELADVLANLAESYRRAGRVEEAVRRLERAQKALAAAPEDNAVRARVSTGLAECDLASGRREQALGILERALELGVRAKLPPQDVAPTRFALARALPAADAQRARDLAREARSWFSKERREAEVQRVDDFLASLEPPARRPTGPARGADPRNGRLAGASPSSPTRGGPR